MVSQKCNSAAPRPVRGTRMHIKSPRVRPAQLAGRCPSAPTPARLRPPLHRSSPLLPAASTSYRAAAGASVAPAAARGREAAESPADAPPPAASAVVVADVVLEHGPGARSSSRPSIVTDDSYPNHLACMWRTQRTSAGSRSADLPRLPLMAPMMESTSPSLHTAHQLVQHALEEVAEDDSASSYDL